MIFIIRGEVGIANGQATRLAKKAAQHRVAAIYTTHVNGDGFALERRFFHIHDTRKE
jgi:hypothetical protein